jgi:hypothetical protein
LGAGGELEERVFEPGAGGGPELGERDAGVEGDLPD